MTTLRQIIAAENVTEDELPLVHTTRCETLELILDNSQLVGPECEVFHEHLVYFFYGRPAYRTRGENVPEGGLELCPVCFVFTPQTISLNTKRVFVCDSGGVVRERFNPHLFSGDLLSLELDASINSARKLVPLVFEDNRHYFLGEAVNEEPAAFPPVDVAHRYYELLQEIAPMEGDDRRSAIEVQVPSPVQVGDNLDYVILPSDWLNKPNVRHTIDAVWNAEAIPYDVTRGTAINECVVTIRNALQQRLGLGLAA